MKRFTTLLTVAILCVTNLYAQQTPKIPYAEGEKLRYSLFYGLMDGGEATITLKKSNNEFHSVAKASTVGMVRWFLNMDDVYESYFDPQTCKPSKAIRNIKENSYKYYDEVVYNHAKNTVSSKKNGEVNVPANIYDIVSSLYQMRYHGFQNAKLNDTISAKVFFADEVFTMQVIYKGKEKISTKLGTFNAKKFQPVVETGRVFRNPDDVNFWVSDDDNLIPIRAEFKVLIGSIKCDLIEYSGVKYPLAIVK